MQVLRKTGEMVRDNLHERFPPIMEAMRDTKASAEKKKRFVASVLGKIHFEQNHVYDSVSRTMGYAAFYGEENARIFNSALLKEFGERKLLYVLQEKNPDVDVTKLSGMTHIGSENFDAVLAGIIREAKREAGL